MAEEPPDVNIILMRLRGKLPTFLVFIRLPLALVCVWLLTYLLVGGKGIAFLVVTLLNFY